jgi:hypothetical protein
LDDNGHALLVLGGYRSFGPEGFRTTPLADVLPVVFRATPPYQSEDLFTLQLTEEGKRHPIFEVSGDREKDAALWAASPKLQGASLVTRAKPSAEVLAINPEVQVEGQPAVVAATQRYGAGHTMVLTVDTTWQWSRMPRVLGQADTLYARFWSQTIRWLAGRSLDDQRPLLTVNTDRPDYNVAQKVEVRVVRQPRPGSEVTNAAVVVDVIGPGKPLRLEMEANSAEPDVFKGSFRPESGGRYEATAMLLQDGNPLANQRSEFLVHGSDLELADTGTNRENLRAMAAATGGLYFDIEDVDGLIKKIPRKDRQYTRVQRTEFWNSPALFLFFVAAVSAEWFIRRWNHLV